MIMIGSINTAGKRCRCSVLAFAAAAVLLPMVAGCEREAAEVEAPPRATSTPPVPAEASFVSVPVELDAAILTRAVEQAVPKTLWSINQHFDRCVPPQRVKVLGRSIKLAPKIGCDVVGTVTRGPITLRGQGRDIIAELPIRAKISARDIGGVLKGETATGSAKAYAVVRLDLAPNWSPKAKIKLRYDWTRPPGIDFLGKRITFTDQADAELSKVVRKLERTLPRELAKLQVRPQVERAWREAFTVLTLNRENPPVWMRITPQKPVYGGYRLEGGRIRLDVGLRAVTETFVGIEPEAPAPTALPAPGEMGKGGALHFYIPVIADYAELEPVIARALAKRSQRPFDLPKFGLVDAKFEDVTAYATKGGRFAVGLKIVATPRSGILGETKGQVWMTARPGNTENSTEVSFSDVIVTGDIQRNGGQFLVNLANSSSVTEEIAGSLTQNFAEDLDDLVAKVRDAIAKRRQGDFLVRTDITGVETGALKAYGSGLYLPVRATGKGRIVFSPR